MDKTFGERALGPQKTISGEVQATVEQVTQQARVIDQQRGFSKIANDVKLCYSDSDRSVDFRSLVLR